MQERCGYKIVIVFILLVIGVCGCTINGSENIAEEETEIVLNERQKSILLEEGLSTNYSELKESQKKAIIAIEEMLVETEQKYEVDFGYISYSNDIMLEGEELVAYPIEGDKDKDIFIITRKKNNQEYTYWDGYACLTARDVFNNYIQEFVLSEVGQGNAKVFSVVTDIANDVYPIKETDIENNISGASWIFIDGASVTESDFEQFLSDYKLWLEKNGISGSMQIMLLKEHTLLYLTEYNYTDYLSPDYYISREFLYL